MTSRMSGPLVVGNRSSANLARLVKTRVVNVDPPSILTIAEGTSVVVVTGIALTDQLIYVGPAPSDARYFLRRATITAVNQVTITWTNESAATIDPAALDMLFAWITPDALPSGA